MVTSDAAAILKWDKRLGSLEAGKYADLLLIDGKVGDPYAALIEATETSIRLVMIGGAPRFGAAALMKKLGAGGEKIRVGGSDRILSLEGTAEDPDVARITLAEAQDSLADALSDLPQLASQAKADMARAKAASAGRPVLTLALDELEDTGFDMRPHLSMPRAPLEATGQRHAACGCTGSPRFAEVDLGSFDRRGRSELFHDARRREEPASSVRRARPQEYVQLAGTVLPRKLRSLRATLYARSSRSSG